VESECYTGGMSERAKKAEAKDRSMSPAEGQGRTFFFPKRNPPVSVRAASRKEAEALLDTNQKEA
jgi:hypothetical protein